MTTQKQAIDSQQPHRLQPVSRCAGNTQKDAERFATLFEGVRDGTSPLSDQNRMVRTGTPTRLAEAVSSARMRLAALPAGRRRLILRS